MGDNDISVSIISQGSSEKNWACSCCWQGLKGNDWIGKEFENDFYSKDVNKITVVDNVSVISIIGQDLSTFQALYSFDKKKIVPILFNNTVTGKMWV
jgi:aspartokinase